MNSTKVHVGTADGESCDMDYSPQFSGYRANYIDLSGKVVVALYGLDGGRQDYQEVASDVEPATLKRHPVQLVANAMCHAVNAGVDPAVLASMAEQLCELYSRSKPPMLGDVQPEGLFIERYPSVSYVLSSPSTPDVAVEVKPDCWKNIQQREELLEKWRELNA